ncbi:MAG: NAD(P)H-dependent oxidoreductase [Myxococcota bacterium]
MGAPADALDGGHREAVWPETGPARTGEARRAKGVVIASPEFNGSIPRSLKSLLDCASRPPRVSPEPVPSRAPRRRSTRRGSSKEERQRANLAGFLDRYVAELTLRP